MRCVIEQKRLPGKEVCSPVTAPPPCTALHSSGVEQVHERGIDTDLVCLVIKLALRRGFAARLHAMRRLRDTIYVAQEEGSGAKRIIELQRAAWLVYARRPRVILMSATFDTTVFVDYFEAVSRQYTEQFCDAAWNKWEDSDTLGRWIGSAPQRRQLSLALPIPEPARVVHGVTPPTPANPVRVDWSSPTSTGLAELIAADSPVTLHVGAKRYPVEVVFLEDVYASKLGHALVRSELAHVATAQFKFDGAARTWATRSHSIQQRGEGRGGDMRAPTVTSSPTCSVSDALMLSDELSKALLRLAVRLAVAAARPGTGDCILIFVAGMADIDSLVNLFLELCPGFVAAPTAKLVTVDLDEAEDADATVLAEGRGLTLAEASRRLDSADLESESEVEVEADVAAQATVPPAATGQRRAKGAPRAPVPISYDATRDRSTIRLLPMHSLISFEDQLAAFAPGGEGGDLRTRVVIATNIAESSVTLPDVHTVIDLGRAKTIEWVPQLRASALRTTWVSQASAAQRTGRAGRLMPGTVYRLYTRAFFEGVMPRYDTPEMLRLALDAVVLKVKMLGVRTAATGEGLDDERDGAGSMVKRPGLSKGVVLRGDAARAVAGMTVPDATPACGVNSAKWVLSQALQPPEPASVDAALEKLAALGALTSADDISEVTPFGKLLANFPGDLALGKLVAFSFALGVVADGIVMAAALAVNDIFLMPHAAVANSLQEYGSLISKVTTARWLFGIDPAFVEPGRRPGPGAGGWSEPIAARNAYIAWRGVPLKVRNAWCASFGIVGRRMVALHSMVREISHRVATLGVPGGMRGHRVGTRNSAITALLGHEREGGAAPADASDDGAPRDGGIAWPPPGLFSPSTQALRIVLVAALGTTLAVGTCSERPSVIKSASAARIDKRRVVRIDASRAPPDWQDSIGLQLAEASTPGETARDQLRSVGPLARSLYAMGVPRQGTRLIGDRTTRILLVHFNGASAGRSSGTSDADDDFGWDVRDYVPADGGFRLYGRGSGTFGTALPVGVRPFLAMAEGRGAARDLCGVGVPLAHAVPVAAMALVSLTSSSADLKLPRVPPDNADRAAMIASGGTAREAVPGAVFASPGSRSTVRLAGLSGVTSMTPAAQVYRSPQPVHNSPAARNVADDDSPVVISTPLLPSSTTWRLVDAMTGYRAFRTASHRAGEAGTTSISSDPKAGLLSNYAARTSQQSLMRLFTDTRPQIADQRLSSAAPLIAVVTGLQLQETNRGFTATMGGMTVMWRSPRQLALALLLYARGVEVQVSWVVSGSTTDLDDAGLACQANNGVTPDAAPIVVHQVVIDPRGRTPLSFGPLEIQLHELHEVSALRMELSKSLSGILVSGSTEGSSLLMNRTMHLLGLNDSTAEKPRPSTLRERRHAVTVCDFAITPTGALSAAICSDQTRDISTQTLLLPPFVTCGGSDDWGAGDAVAQLGGDISGVLGRREHVSGRSGPILNGMRVARKAVQMDNTTQRASPRASRRTTVLLPASVSRAGANLHRMVTVQTTAPSIAGSTSNVAQTIGGAAVSGSAHTGVVVSSASRRGAASRGAVDSTRDAAPLELPGRKATADTTKAVVQRDTAALAKFKSGLNASNANAEETTKAWRLAAETASRSMIALRSAAAEYTAAGPDTDAVQRACDKLLAAYSMEQNESQRATKCRIEVDMARADVGVAEAKVHCATLTLRLSEAKAAVSKTLKAEAKVAASNKYSSKVGTQDADAIAKKAADAKAAVSSAEAVARRCQSELETAMPAIKAKLRKTAKPSSTHVPKATQTSGNTAARVELALARAQNL